MKMAACSACWILDSEVTWPQRKTMQGKAKTRTANGRAGQGRVGRASKGKARQGKARRGHPHSTRLKWKIIYVIM